MKALLICPAERESVRSLAETAPLAHPFGSHPEFSGYSLTSKSRNSFR